jgi:tetratricopeptide (TPR) repeat protein
MKPGIRALLALTASVLAQPVAAKEVAPRPLGDLAAMSRDDLVDLFTQEENRWFREPCTFGAPLLAELENRSAGATPIRRLRLYTDALCADREKRYADGAKIVRTIAALTPDDPETGLAIWFASRLDDADALLSILRGLDPAALGRLDRDDFWSAVRTVTGQGRGGEMDALALAWVDGGKLAFMDVELHQPVAMRALRAAAAAGRSDVTDQLLLSITDPVTYIDLLTQRSYAPFWPQIEARAGANLSLVGDEHVAQTAARLTIAPKDRDRFSEAAHALHFNGQFAEAIALAKRWSDQKAKGADIEEGDAWALNIQAYAYDSLGEFKKADAVFDELAKLDPDEHPWVVNFVINRASRITGQGRWKQGLAANDLARKVAEQHGSTYAKMIVASNSACALERLGRAGAAAGDLAYLRENRKEGVALTVRGLLCHGLKDEAAALLLEGLRDEGTRERALNAFQTDELDLFYTATILPQAPDLLAGYPELAAELAKYVRPMPEGFIPRASLKRVSLKEGAAR